MYKQNILCACIYSFLTFKKKKRKKGIFSSLRQYILSGHVLYTLAFALIKINFNLNQFLPPFLLGLNNPKWKNGKFNFLILPFFFSSFKNPLGTLTLSPSWLFPRVKINWRAAVSFIYLNLSNILNHFYYTLIVRLYFQ